MKILILSDLHCHSVDRLPRQSLFLAGSATAPATHHPFAALAEMVGRGQITFDALISPGDLTDQIDRPGFVHSWDQISLLAARAGNRPVVVTLGNHDVDSRRKFGLPLEIARRLSDRFPVEGADLVDSFFHRGFCCKSVSADLEILMINTVVDHTDEATAKRGTFGPDRIAELEKAIAPRPRLPFRIALLHHHPVLHSSPMLAAADVLLAGDQLVDALARLGCGLVVHGHKHHPRLRLHNTPSGVLPILAAGSFSADLGSLWTHTRNVFHLMEVQAPRNKRYLLSGTLKTWEWRQGLGWKAASLSSADFPPHSGFGAATSGIELAQDLEAFFLANVDTWRLAPDQASGLFPELKFLAPDEQAEMSAQLERTGLLRAEIRGEGFEIFKLHSVEG